MTGAFWHLYYWMTSKILPYTKEKVDFSLSVNIIFTEENFVAIFLFYIQVLMWATENRYAKKK